MNKVGLHRGICVLPKVGRNFRLAVGKRSAMGLATERSPYRSTALNKVKTVQPNTASNVYLREGL